MDVFIRVSVLMFLLIFHISAKAQLFSFLTTEKGLSNDRVYSIAKDKHGYMWFLTAGGVDRFDGLDFFHFNLEYDGVPLIIGTRANLVADNDGRIWEVGSYKSNVIYVFDDVRGRFKPVVLKNLGDSGISYLMIDSSNRIWMSSGNALYVYDIDRNHLSCVLMPDGEAPLCMAEFGGSFVVGSSNGIYEAHFDKKKCIFSKMDWPIYDTAGVKVSDMHSLSPFKMYSYRNSRKLLVFDSKSRMFDVDLASRKVVMHSSDLIYDVPISSVSPDYADSSKLLVATASAGIKEISLDDFSVSDFVKTEYDNDYSRGCNVIVALYSDREGKRVWFSPYSYGVACYNAFNPHYVHNRHIRNNEQSLSSDLVVDMIEDSDGDIWYATSGGIDLFDKKQREWKHFVMSGNENFKVFISLCEVEPGSVLVGGKSDNLYIINKYDRSIVDLAPEMFGLEHFANSWIEDVYKDDFGNVWMGGDKCLDKIDWNTKTITSYELCGGARFMARDDSLHFWLSTNNDIYRVNVLDGKLDVLDKPARCRNVNDILCTENGNLYIATSDEGLFVRDSIGRFFMHYTRSNSSLPSDNVLSVVEDNEGNVVLSTGNGLSRFDARQRTFSNWTYEQGMHAYGFYAACGIRTSDNRIIFGSNSGTVEFADSVRLPHSYNSKILITRLTVNGHDRFNVHNLNEIELEHNENILAVTVGSLNFDNPSDIKYSWKLDGLDDGWSKPSSERIINYELHPGHFTLNIRAYSGFNGKMIDECSIPVVVSPPWWGSLPAKILYYMLGIFAILVVYRLILLKNRRLIAEEKVNFFIHTAHEIRTPLTLLKAPLEDVMRNEVLSEKGKANLQIAMHSANELMIMTGDLINAERHKISEHVLCVSQVELNSFINEMLRPFNLYANTKKQKLTYSSDFKELYVILDRGRIESILQNLVNNALKYTPDGGAVEVKCSHTDKWWAVDVSDNGIGVPEDDKSRLFEKYYRASNVGKNIVGTGLGLSLVKALVEEHHGRISFESEEGKGSRFRVEFPYDEKFYADAEKTCVEYCNCVYTKENPVVLVVEDNADLQSFIRNSLSVIYTVYVANNGAEALEKVRFLNPDIIVSDVMMPEMRGDEMCRALKADVKTSHIPVVLLTALADNDSVIDGLSTLADAYMTKPFDVEVLKAQIESILANRKVMQNRYADLIPSEMGPDIKSTNELDLKFMDRVRSIVDANVSNKDFNVDTLCMEIGMSRTSFYGKLKALTDNSPSDYIRFARLNRAKSLLLQNEMQVSEISEACGFSDVKYFREVFRRHFGMTPSQFRAER